MNERSQAPPRSGHATSGGANVGQRRRVRYMAALAAAAVLVIFGVAAVIQGLDG